VAAESHLKQVNSHSCKYHEHTPLKHYKVPTLQVIGDYRVIISTWFHETFFVIVYKGSIAHFKLTQTEFFGKSWVITLRMRKIVKFGEQS
jgi:hypothetical protein